MGYLGTYKTAPSSGILELPLFSPGDFSPQCLRTYNNGSIAQFKLVSTSDSAASPMRVQTTNNGIMSVAKKVFAFTEDWNAFSGSYSFSGGSYSLQTDNGNYVRLTTSSIDSILRMLNIFSLDPYTWRYFEVRYKTTYASSTEVFYMMSGRYNDSWGSQDQTFSFGLNTSGNWTVYVKDLWELPYYRGYGNFMGFRYDPIGELTGAVIDIDYIRIWRA